MYLDNRNFILEKKIFSYKYRFFILYKGLDTLFFWNKVGNPSCTQVVPSTWHECWRLRIFWLGYFFILLEWWVNELWDALVPRYAPPPPPFTVCSDTLDFRWMELPVKLLLIFQPGRMAGITHHNNSTNAEMTLRVSFYCQSSSMLVTSQRKGISLIIIKKKKEIKTNDDSYYRTRAFPLDLMRD